MFRIDQSDVKLKSCLMRTENHGKEIKSAITMKCNADMKSVDLDLIRPGLMMAFYNHKETENENDCQQELIKGSVFDMFTELKFDFIEPLKLTIKEENYRLVVHNALEPLEAEFIMAECNLSAFVLTLKKDGIVGVEFNIAGIPRDKDVGWLFGHLAKNIILTLEPPKQHELLEVVEALGGIAKSVPGESVVVDVEGVDDPLFDNAVEFSREKGKASISTFQRHFQIGYNRADKLIQALETQGWLIYSDGDNIRTFNEVEVKEVA